MKAAVAGRGFGEARSCPSISWQRQMSMAGRSSRPQPPEAVAAGQVCLAWALDWR